jgi:hypothetical protein
MLLLLAAPMGESDKYSINVKYLAKLFGDDWGFYYTATTNLGRIKEGMTGVKVLIDDQRAIIDEKVDYLCQYLESAPKSGKWKGRAKVGTSRPWYNEVSDW